jgi:hypothetical protein
MAPMKARDAQTAAMFNLEAKSNFGIEPIWISCQSDQQTSKRLCDREAGKNGKTGFQPSRNCFFSVKALMI